MYTRLTRSLLAALPALAAAALLLLWLGDLAPAQAAGPDVRYVSPTGDDSGQCDSPANACRSLQRAVDVAPAGAEIHIASGTYTGTAGTVAAITKELALRGGYSTDFSIFDPDGFEAILDGRWAGSVVSMTNAGDVTLQHLTLTHGDGSASCPVFGCGGGVRAIDTNLHVLNTTIIDNVAGHSGGTGARGGGVYAQGTSQSVEIRNSRILSNTAEAGACPASATCYYAWGGGLYIESGTAQLVENDISRNAGQVYPGVVGAGISLLWVNHADVLSNTIQGNEGLSSGGSQGGGIYIGVSKDVYVAGNRIEDNVLPAGCGGGVCVSDAAVHLDRNIITGNSVTWYEGGGVRIAGSEPVTLTNNLIALNEAGDGRGGGLCMGAYGASNGLTIVANDTIADNGDSAIVVASDAQLYLVNSIVAGQATGVSASSPASSTIGAELNLFSNDSDPIIGLGAIEADPQFASGFRLHAGSPAIDAGAAIPWLPAVQVDLLGVSRPQGDSYDLGAFEGAVPYSLYLPLALRNR